MKHTGLVPLGALHSTVASQGSWLVIILAAFCREWKPIAKRMCCQKPHGQPEVIARVKLRKLLPVQEVATVWGTQPFYPRSMEESSAKSILPVRRWCLTPTKLFLPTPTYTGHGVRRKLETWGEIQVVPLPQTHEGRNHNHKDQHQ